MGLAPPSLPLLRPRSVVPLVGGLGTSGSRSFKGGVVSGVQARRPLSLHQRSPSPFLLDSIIITPHTCAPPHQIPGWSPSSVDYLDTSLPSLCLARLPTLICVSMYVHCVFLLPITFGFVRSGHQHYVAVWGVPFLIIVLFLPVGF